MDNTLRQDSSLKQDSQRKLLSVIIPVYNTADYLTRCVDSLLAQTYPDIEIVLIDDGSTDNSGSICEDYARKHGNIRVAHQKNQGQSKARDNGVAISNGEFITFVDSDDYISDSTTFEKCIAAFDDDVQIVQYPYTTYHSDANLNYKFCMGEECPHSAPDILKGTSVRTTGGVFR